MNTHPHEEQRILQNARAASLDTSIDSFLIDRQAEGLSHCSIDFYRHDLRPFHTYCNDNSVTLVQDITPDLLRRFFLNLAERHSPGGVHAFYRSLRALFRWLVLEEVMPLEWRNPMLKIKPPKVNVPPLEPISRGDVRALIGTCQGGTRIGERDRAIFLFLLDTEARAQEACNTMLADIDLNTGSVTFRCAKGEKTRTVFLGKKAGRALRAYLRTARILNRYSSFLAMATRLPTTLFI